MRLRLPLASMRLAVPLLLLAARPAVVAADPPAWKSLAGPKHSVLAADDSKKRIVLFDENGVAKWERAVRFTHDLHLLPDGNILMQETPTLLLELDAKGETVWSYDAGKSNGNEGKRVEVHAFQRLADGITMIAESGPCRAIEVDREGRLLRETRLQVDNPDVHRHTRLVRKLENGNYLVCHEGDGRVREYAPDGAIVWQYDLPGEATFDHHEGTGKAVFGAVRLPNGNTLIATGNGHSVLEVTPAKEIVWKLSSEDLPGIELGWVTTLEVLPDGNIVVGNCHAGPENPQILEVTRDKRLVWAFHDFERMGNSLTNSLIVELQGRTIR